MCPPSPSPLHPLGDFSSQVAARESRDNVASLRHSTATLLLDHGVELVTIKELLCHAHTGAYAYA